MVSITSPCELKPLHWFKVMTECDLMISHDCLRVDFHSDRSCHRSLQMNTASIQPAHIMATPTCSLKRGTNVETAASKNGRKAERGYQKPWKKRRWVDEPVPIDHIMVIPGNTVITVIRQSHETSIQCLSIAPVWIDTQSGYLGKLWIYILPSMTKSERMCLGRLGSFFDECELENAVNAWMRECNATWMDFVPRCCKCSSKLHRSEMFFFASFLNLLGPVSAACGMLRFRVTARKWNNFVGFEPLLTTACTSSQSNRTSWICESFMFWFTSFLSLRKFNQVFEEAHAQKHKNPTTTTTTTPAATTPAATTTTTTTSTFHFSLAISARGGCGNGDGTVSRLPWTTWYGLRERKQHWLFSWTYHRALCQGRITSRHAATWSCHPAPWQDLEWARFSLQPSPSGQSKPLPSISAVFSKDVASRSQRWWTKTSAASTHTVHGQLPSRRQCQPLLPKPEEDIL